MKKTTFFLILCSLIAASCSKEVNTVEAPVEELRHERTFVVSSPETRTMLDNHAILWGANDKIRVIGYSAPKAEGEQAASEQAIFDIVSGVGEKTASFSGTIGDFDSYFAIYPSDKEVKEESLPKKLELKSAMNMTAISAVENGFDPSYAIMTAIADENGKLVFRHGVAYIKIQIAEDGVSTVKISLENNATGARPIYDASNGSISSVESGTNVIMASGSFVKGSYYYFPVSARSSNPGKVTVEYTNNGLTSSISTNSLAKVRFEVGMIWDLGCPPISFNPVIQAEAPSKLAFDAEGGSFTYSIANAPEGAVAEASVPADSWISDVVVSGNTVSFVCSKNDAADAEERTAVITLSYEGADDYSVLIKQGVNGGSNKEVHNWNFSEYTVEQMRTITGIEADAKATAGLTWNFGDGLTMVTNGSSKWNIQTIDGIEYKWVATGGKYGSNQKFFSFTTNSVGTVTVLYASGANASRALTLNANGTESIDTENVSTGTSDLKTVSFTAVSNGTIMLYSKDDNIRVYSIDFMED